MSSYELIQAHELICSHMSSDELGTLAKIGLTSIHNLTVCSIACLTYLELFDKHSVFVEVALGTFLLPFGAPCWTNVRINCEACLVQKGARSETLDFYENLF